MMPLLVGGTRALVMALARQAPTIAATYLATKAASPKPMDITDPDSLRMAIGNEILSYQPKWIVPINGADGNTQLVGRSDLADPSPPRRQVSAEAYRITAQLAPALAAAIARSGRTMSGPYNPLLENTGNAARLVAKPNVMLDLFMNESRKPRSSVLEMMMAQRTAAAERESPEARAAADNMRTVLATCLDVAKAVDVITKFDPRPGSLESRFIAEEQRNRTLSDFASHQALRDYLFGRDAITSRSMTQYRRDVAPTSASLPDVPFSTLSAAGGNSWSSGADPFVPGRVHSWELYEGQHDRPQPRIALLENAMHYNVLRDSILMDSSGEAGECCPFQTAEPSLHDGHFYSSPTFTARVGDLDPGVYGETRIDALPFEIVISNRNVPDRALISFIHEALHGYDELHKLGIDHNQLHSLAVYLTSEAVPAYLELKRKLQPNN